ncbi:MAG: hydroxysqualene dehydroxylase HpnE [Blastocatellia bacterium]
MSKRVVIIGGGFSGLAAGVTLIEQGVDVLLLERRNHLGGRAYSFIDSKTGSPVDNGQHLFMGCYHHTIAFLQKIGCLDRLKFQDRPRVDFLDRSDGFVKFECPPLPAPFHVVAGLLRMKGLTLGDKIRAINVGRAIRGNGSLESLTVAQWLDNLAQSGRIRQRFWYPMVIATLNEDPHIASARMLKRVLEESFGGGRSSTAIGIARVPLSDLYTGGAREFIESRGGQVKTGAEVARLVVERDAVVAAELKSGETFRADYFISAVPPNAFMQILDEETAKTFLPIGKLESSPIVSINLWFDRQVIDREFTGLIGTRCQWVFNKDLILSTEKKTNQIAVIISAARDFVDWTREALVEMALSELHEMIPASQHAKLIQSAIVKEREATMAHTVESDHLRPGPRTALTNLVLAGDWTDTGLPATIESAVLSGRIAAQMVDSQTRVD